MTEFDRRRFITTGAGALAGLAMLPALSRGTSIRVREPIGLAVIGTGRQGLAILGELQKFDAVKVVATCDVDRARRDSGLRRAPGATGYESHEELLQRERGVQAVVIATPTHLHRQIAIDALAAGKHVYCEAPLAHTLDDCRAIAAAARGSRTLFQAGLEAPSNPIYKLARSFYRSGSIGDLVSLRAQSHQKTSWRTPVSDPARERALNWKLDPDVSLGLAGEMGTQQFATYHFFLGRYPVRITGQGSIKAWNDGREVADTISVGVEFPDDVLLHYRSTLCNSYEGRYEVIHGTNGAFKLAWTAAWLFKEADAPTQGWEVYANREQFHNDEGITLIADATKLAAQGKLREGVGLPNAPLHYSLGDFIASIAEGTPVVCGAEEGLRATVVGIVAHEAVRRGETVTIDPELFKGS